MNTQQALTQLWDWLTAPSVAVTKAQDRRNGRLLAAILVLLISASLFNLVVVGDIPFFVIFLLLLAYILSRTRYYMPASILAVFSLPLPLIVSLMTQSPFSQQATTSALIWFVLPFLLASLLSKMKWLLIYITIIFAIILVMPLAIKELSYTHLWESIGFLGAFAFFLLIFKQQRDLIETDRQAELRLAELRLQQQSAELGALRQVGIEFTTKSDLDTLLQFIISQAVPLLRGARGGLFLYQPETGGIHFMAQHWPDRDRPGAVAQLGPGLPLGTIIQPGEGVVGKVWQTNEALIVPNYQQWSGKAESLAGSVTALCMMGVPIRWEDTTYGVLTIVAHPGQQFATADVDLMTLFAAQAAVAIQRTHQTNTIKRQVAELEQEVEQRKRIEKELRRSEEEAREFQEKLQALHEVNIELSRCSSLEELYRRTIELGRARLGFDRLGLFLIEEETNMMLGTFGTDENGELKDERLFRKVQENPEITGILTEQKRIGFWQDTPLKDAGEVVGWGWNAMTVLWSGNKGIGWLATDNLIRHEPPTAVQLEILILYGATLGQLVSRKQVEEERERLIEELEAKNAELERFTYTVSHDLKSPLVTVKGFLGYLERDAGQRNWESVWKDIGRIRGATDKMEMLLKDLLELSRVGRVVNAPQQVSFNEIAQEALSLVHGRVNEREVEVEIASDLPTVIVDKPRLVEVMQNLLDNSVKFMGEQPEPKIVVGTRQEVGETLFFVADNGKGIEQKYYDKVFGLFERLDQSVEGTGIGLALVKRIVEVHNGRIWVESDGKGKGTTFLFTLPIHHEL